MATSDYLLARRNDLSGYLIHLTRQYGRKSAHDNLVAILDSGRIRARNAYCLSMYGLDEAERKLFRAVCFTDTPLSELNYVTQDMAGRRIKLSQYGLVFRKETILEAGGNPVFYLHARSESGKRRVEAMQRLLRVARKEGADGHSYATVLPLVNRVDKTIDFTWEREWRIVGDFGFRTCDVFLGLAPTRQVGAFENDYPNIPWISPRWGRDQIISKLRECASRAGKKGAR